jgi:hypothetical protein
MWGAGVEGDGGRGASGAKIGEGAIVGASLVIKGGWWGSAAGCRLGHGHSQRGRPRAGGREVSQNRR